MPVQSVSKWHPRSVVPEVHWNTRSEEFLIFVDPYDGSGWADMRAVRWPVEDDKVEAEVGRVPGTELEALVNGKQLFLTFLGPEETVPAAVREARS